MKKPDDGRIRSDETERLEILIDQMAKLNQQVSNYIQLRKSRHLRSVICGGGGLLISAFVFFLGAAFIPNLIIPAAFLAGLGLSRIME